MKLNELLTAIPDGVVTGDVQREIASLRYDSRRVAPRDVFFAWRGQNTDGHRFIPEVCDRGAAAVVLEDRNFVGEGSATFVEVPDARRALARMAAVYYGNPSTRLKVIGITGTKGKTTTSYLLKHLLESVGMSMGLIGTIRYEVGRRILPASRTTPEGSDLQELLGQMQAAGCSGAVMEVSSHALAQGRVDPIAFETAVFTNLGQDHLDYHKNINDYFEAKAQLFRQIRRPDGVAVINMDDPRGASIIQKLDPSIRLIGFSVTNAKGSQVAARQVRFDLSGTFFQMRLGETWYPVEMPLLGEFNVENALAASAVAWAWNISPEQIVEALQKAPAVPGRLESFCSNDGVTAVVDYAHTEESVRAILKTLRALQPKRLLVVLGCGGNRDKAKRPKMARAAVDLADYAIFTADNPRNELIDAILQDMVAGVKQSTHFTTNPDRREAIAEALAQAQPGDVVCIAGKGHEATQEINGMFLPFDDRQVVQEFLMRRAG